MTEKSMTFDKKAKDIDKKIAKMPDLEEVIVEEGNPDFLSKEGLLFKKDGKKMVGCPKGRMECRVPDGTTFIRNLQDCHKLQKLYIPKTVTDIGRQFFSGCDALEEITIEGAKLKFKAEHFGKNGMPKKLLPQILDLSKNLSPDAIAAFVLDNNAWKELPAETVIKLYLMYYSKTLEFHFDPVVRQIGADTFAELIVRSLQNKSSKKGKEAAAKFLLQYGTQLNEQNRTNLDACLEGKEIRLTKEESDALEIMAGRTDSFTPLEQKSIEYMTADGLTTRSLETRLKEYFGLMFKDLPEIKDPQGNTVPHFVFAWLLTAHGNMREQWNSGSYYKAEYHQAGVRPEAAEIVSLLDSASLKAALNELANTHLQKYQNTKKKFLSHPFCRYADEDMMAELTKRAPKWQTSVSGDAAPPLIQLRGAVLYSDTHAAMLFAERYHELDSYAKLRGKSEDDIRDRYLSDIGLNKNGGKAYDLGNQKVVVRLQKDLSFLVELPDGKTAKSIPKRGADPAKYEAAKTDFSRMKKTSKKILKNRGQVLFADFLSGHTRKAEDWQTSYLTNPLLREAAALVVWSQGSKTFTLLDGEPIDNLGQPYSIGSKPIKVAHPMEMDPADTQRWQMYFTSHGLKQPFEQVWEPVRSVELIRPDRYKGCEVSVLQMSGKDKHGIHSYGLFAYSEDFGFTLDDCSLDYTPSTWRLDYDWGYEGYTLEEFSFHKFTRKVNHIVTILDNLTILGRIRKDDPGIMDMMDSFTLAQITDFIKEAQDAGANNLLAQLMDYKNRQFADYDPMDEFTLEW